MSSSRLRSPRVGHGGPGLRRQARRTRTRGPRRLSSGNRSLRRQASGSPLHGGLRSRRCTVRRPAGRVVGGRIGGAGKQTTDPREALAGDGEVLGRALRLRAVERVGGDADLAEGVGFDAVVGHGSRGRRTEGGGAFGRSGESGVRETGARGSRRLAPRLLDPRLSTGPRTWALAAGAARGPVRVGGLGPRPRRCRAARLWPLAAFGRGSSHPCCRSTGDRACLTHSPSRCP